MLLAVDIGNSAIKFGVFDQNGLISKFSIPTDRDIAADQLKQQIDDRIGLPINAAIACSVVPELDDEVASFIKDSFHTETQFVRSTDDMRLTINFPVTTTGADRLVNSFAASEKYGMPCVVISFGTATTIDVINAKREYLGGLIAPGMKASAQALARAASKLPEIELEKPPRVIAQTTKTAIQSGIVYGHIAMVKGLLKRVKSEINDVPIIVATGGFARLLATEIKEIQIVDDDLTLNGLRLLHDRDSN